MFTEIKIHVYHITSNAVCKHDMAKVIQLTNALSHILRYFLW